jgi:hypothetical protein
MPSDPTRFRDALDGNGLATAHADAVAKPPVSRRREDGQDEGRLHWLLRSSPAKGL